MTDLAQLPDLAPAPTTLFASPDPALIVAEATRVAGVLAPVITDRHLYAPISGKKYPTLEAWTLLGMLMRTTISPHVTRTWQTDNGWGAHAEARTLDGQVVSAADAYCMRDEEKWQDKPNHQVASMASTRACSRAMRLPLSFVMSLTGYEVTPAEEMEAAARGETVSGGKGVAFGWRDLAEQETAHRRMHAFFDEHGVQELAGKIVASKGYGMPLSKPQMADLRRAIDREVQEQSDPGSRASSDAAGGNPTSASPGSGQPSEGDTASAQSTHHTRRGQAHAGASRQTGDGAPSDPTSPSTPEQEAGTDAGRSGVEGANHDGNGPGAGSRDGATSPPDPASPPRGRAGGTKGSRPAPSPGKADAAGRATSEEADQAKFEAMQSGDDPREWRR